MLIFNQDTNRGIVVVEHKGLLNDIANNWKSIKTVKIIGKHMFIMNCSFDYFIELTRNKRIPHKVITKF